MAKKRFIRIKDIKVGVEELYEKGATKGLYCGFENLYNHYSPKMGYSTIVFGSFFSGKSEWTYELLISLAELHGIRTVLFSPESGNAKEVAAELLSKAIRKPFYTHNGMANLSKKEFESRYEWVDHYFTIIDNEDGALTLDDFYEQVDLVEQETGRVHFTLADPWNELSHTGMGERQDLYLEASLGVVNQNAKQHQRHNIIITHTSRQELIKAVTKDGKEIRYNPQPTAKDVAGGEAYGRKGHNILGLWRPPHGLNDDDGTPFENNELHVNVLKFKPKFSGVRGMVKFYYDVSTNRYYEMFNGQKRYSGKQYVAPPTYTQAKITPNLTIETRKDENDYDF